MKEETYKKLKKQYRASTQPPTDVYLCKVPPTGEAYFDIKYDKLIYGQYTKEQNGYKMAIERTPVPQAEQCPACGQELARKEEKLL